MTIKVLVNGAAGRMGRQVCQTVEAHPELDLVGRTDIDDNLATTLSEAKPDVMVDFTRPDAVIPNIREALEHNVHAVVGTTGITENNLSEIEAAAKESSANVIVAPNFAIGAVLMMQLAKVVARYMKACEIIELHHDQKADAPSGTAIKTAEGLALEKAARVSQDESETVECARGGVVKGAHIHSVRLPGLVAHQEVIFGSLGQTLTIRHDSISRESFMPGVVMAIKEVAKRPGLTYGLEKLLDI